MDFNDIFRSFFGFHGPRGFGHVENDSDDADFFNTPNYGFFGNPRRDYEDDDDDDDITFGQGHSGWFPPSGGDMFFKFEEDTQDIFRHFEEMFKGIGLSEQPPAFSRIDQEPSPPSSSKRFTPRDGMLKHPDSFQPLASNSKPESSSKDRLKGYSEETTKNESPSWFSMWTPRPRWHWPTPSLPPTSPQKEDKDLDDDIKANKLEEILRQRQPPSSQPRSYFKRITVQTIRKPDGTVEQRRTETDGDGNVTTTVTSDDPKVPESPPCAPSFQGPRSDTTSPPGDDETIETLIGQAKTNSIFDKLFGLWGR